MNKSFYFSILISFSCSLSTNQSDSGSKFNEDGHLPKRAAPAFVIIDSLNIYANIKLAVFYLDSILAEVTVFNNEKMDFVMYSPILPSDTLVENTFAVLDERFQNVRHFRKETNHKYFFGNQDTMPAILPEIDSFNLYSLKAGDSISFQINLSKLYDIREASKRNQYLLIEYGNLFPYILGRKHVYLEDSITKTPRPVYIAVTGRGSALGIGRVKILLPKR